MGSKKNLLVAQSGGPTMVINQSMVGVVEAALKHEGIDDIIGGLRGVEGMLKEELVNLRTENINKLNTIAGTSGSGLMSCRFKPKVDDCLALFEIMNKHDVHYFFYIGGNDSALSASTVNQIARDRNYELRVFHVPKTVDNDLLVTHHCPGYGSAARYVALVHMGDDMDNRSLRGIKINVCMGRNAGWLTAGAALARQNPDDGPHLIYLPERNITLKKFAEDVLTVYENLGRCVVAVSEGVSGPDGETFTQSQAIRDELVELGMESIIGLLDAYGEVENAAGGAKRDAFGHIQLSGTGLLGDFLASVVKIYAHNNRKFGPIRMRADTLGYAQRAMMGVASKVDQQEARLVGNKAVEYCMRGDIDGSIAINRLGDENSPYAVECFLANLMDVADPSRPSAEQIKIVPDEMISADSNDVTEKFVEYARPLVGDLPDKGILNFTKL